MLTSRLYKFSLFLLIPMMTISLYLIFIWSPIEKTMGVVQKIFYFHVAAAWTGMLAFFIVFLYSIAYLIKRERKYDLIAGVSAEVGIVFTTIVLITGPIWGRSSWNTWWSWEPRLTTTLILWFLYIAYLMIRQIDRQYEKKARLAAVFGIIGFVDVPIVYMSIRWWNSRLHPVVFGEGANQSGGGIDSSMLLTLIFGVVTMTILYFLILQKGVYIEQAKITVQQMKEQLQGKMM